MLHDPDANQAFIDALKKNLDPAIPIRELPLAINEPAFAAAAADTLLAFLEPRT